MKHFDRRMFLGGGLSTLAGAARLPGWLAAAAQGKLSGERALVVLELAGGNDGLNTLVPFSDDNYRRLRPMIGIPREQCLTLDDNQGLHPSLARLREWYERGCVAVQRGVGYPRPNLSHFVSRDIWSCARTDELLAAEGWLWGASADEDALALMALGCDNASPIARGQGGCALAINNLAAFRLDLPSALEDREISARKDAFLALTRGTRQQSECEYTAARQREALQCLQRLQSVSRSERGVDYPSTTLARDLSGCADVLTAGLPTRLFHVQQTGYDTHANQVRTHARLLSELDAALDAFLRDLSASGNLERTLVLVFSEFGRRAAESGVSTEAGTDHGAASIALLVGGGVRGGIYGQAPDLGALDEVGNLVYTSDFRSLLREALEGWLGLDARALLGGDWPSLDMVRRA